MFSQEFMRNALLAGTFIALACGVSGWFVVLRGQVFAGDALSHVAFPGALAAAVAGIDERVGLFAATVAIGAGIGMFGRRSFAGGGARASGAAPADDTAIGIAFTFILGLGVFFLTLFSTSSGGGTGIQAAHTLFGSIFGLAAGEARLAAVVACAAVLLTAAIARPLLFASVAPDVAAARGVPTRLLGVGFVALLGVVAAEATQAVGALLLLGLLTGPAAAAHRLTASPFMGIALAGLLGVAAMWGGLTLSYAVPSLPPSTAIVTLAVAVYAAAAAASGWTRGRPRAPKARGETSSTTAGAATAGAATSGATTAGAATATTIAR
jgi:zinc/manganese transport system permease protein